MREIVFLALGVGAILLTGRPLFKPRSYRFFRLLAFESLLLLVYVNSPSWFSTPFAVLQLISWVLLGGSAILAVNGFWMLHTYGQPEGSIETTTRLVDTGIYRFIRHPLYTSLMLFCWGVFLKAPSWKAAGLSLGVTAFLMATALFEEEENLARFGEAYTEYSNHTWRMIPFLY